MAATDQDRINALYRELKGEPSTNGNGHHPHVLPTKADEEIVEKVRAERNGKFDRLYMGDLSDYGHDHSSSDDGFVHKLWPYTQDEDQIRRIHAASGLHRPEKSGQRARYLQYSIDRARKNVDWFYDWESGKRVDVTFGGLKSRGGDDVNTTDANAPSTEVNPLITGLVDLAGMIEKGVEPPEELEPGILLRGKVHHIFAPAAVGKTYLALWLAARQLERGNKVLYMDAENGARIFTERLGQMGVSTEAIRGQLFYLPFPTLEMNAGGVSNYVALIESIDPTLVIFDSWIKFLSSAGLEENDNDHIARWAASFLQPIRNADITSVVLDHVPHDGNRSRGASRKRDEVDVQYALIKTQKFDRAAVGEIRLKLEKDREGWLPEFTTFAIGGTKDRGFLFERGTTTDGPGQIILKTKEKEAFEILAGEFGEAGARHNEWRKACLQKGISKTSFGRARDELIRVQLVRREEDAAGPLYLPVLDPVGSTGDGPDFSRYIRVIPDRVQEGPNRVHEPDGSQEGPEGPTPLGVGSLDPAHGPGAIYDERESVKRRYY